MFWEYSGANSIISIFPLRVCAMCVFKTQGYPDLVVPRDMSSYLILLIAEVR